MEYTGYYETDSTLLQRHQEERGLEEYSELIVNATEMHWQLDTSVRTCLFIPTSPDLQYATGAARTVYYCPGSSAVVTGLVFELYMAIENTVSNRRLAEYLHNSYTNAVKNDRSSPSALVASLFAQSATKLDDHNLYIQIETRSELSYRIPQLDRPEFRDPSDPKRSLRPSRVVKLIMFSHHVLVYILNKFSHDRELSIRTSFERTDEGTSIQEIPPRHACVLLYMYEPPPNKPGANTKKHVGKKPIKYTRHLEATMKLNPEELLVKQLRYIAIDEFKLRTEMENLKLKTDAKARAVETAAMKLRVPVSADTTEDANYREIVPDSQLNTPPLSQTATPLRESGTNLWAVIPSATAIQAHGRVIPGAFFRKIAPAFPLETSKLWGNRPPLLEEECAHIGCVEWLVDVKHIHFVRQFGFRGTKRARESDTVSTVPNADPSAHVQPPHVTVKQETKHEVIVSGWEHLFED